MFSEFFTIIYYQLFRFERLTVRVFGYPSKKLGQALMRYQFKRAKSKGKTLYIRPGVAMNNIQEYEEFMQDFSYGKRSSISSYFADIHIFCVIGFILIGTTYYVCGLFHVSFFTDIHSKTQAFFIGVLVFFTPTLWLQWKLIGTKMVYLKKWREYEKKSVGWHRKTALMSLFIIIATWVYMISGVVFMISHAKP